MSTAAFETKQVDIDVVRSIIEEVRTSIGEEKTALLNSTLDTLIELLRLVQQKGTTIRRLRSLFGLEKSERLEVLFGQESAEKHPQSRERMEEQHESVEPLERPSANQDAAPVGETMETHESPEAPNDPTFAAESGDEHQQSSDDSKPRTRRGGRRKASDYQGPEIVVNHSDLRPGDTCSSCQKAKVYPGRPSVIVVIEGQPPLVAEKYRIETLRCGSCGAVFKPELPEAAKGPKYRASSIAVLAALHYTFGMPFHRQDRLQELVSVPVPASTQWKLLNEAERVISPVHEALQRHAAQSRLFHIDDTYLRLLEPDGSPAIRRESQHIDPNRTGQYATGVLTVDASEHRVALFFTGQHHAGENLLKLLEQRPSDLHPPILMSDALSRNTSGIIDSMVIYCAYCFAHARRGVVYQVENFPEEAQTLLRLLAQIFHTDKKAKALGLSGRQRRTYHRKQSQPVLKALKREIQRLFDERRIEPNSDMGRALRYIRRHWKQLTLFLRQPDVPLTNNACERLLKVAIRYRKNSYFYKNPRGAEVGDTYMAIAHTAELNGKNPIHYLTALLQNPDAVAENPEAWLPWTYEATMEGEAPEATSSEPDPRPEPAHT